MHQEEKMKADISKKELDIIHYTFALMFLNDQVYKWQMMLSDELKKSKLYKKEIKYNLNKINKDVDNFTTLMFQLQNEYSYEDSIALAIAEEELEEYIESFNSVMKNILSRSSSDLTTVSCAAKCHTINMLCGMAKKFIKSFGIRNQIGSNGLIDPYRVGRSEMDGFYMSTTEYLSKELSGLLIKDVILIEEDSKKIKIAVDDFLNKMLDAEFMVSILDKTNEEAERMKNL